MYMISFSICIIYNISSGSFPAKPCCRHLRPRLVGHLDPKSHRAHEGLSGTSNWSSVCWICDLIHGLFRDQKSYGSNHRNYFDNNILVGQVPRQVSGKHPWIAQNKTTVMESIILELKRCIAASPVLQNKWHSNIVLAMGKLLYTIVR